MIDSKTTVAQNRQHRNLISWSIKLPRYYVAVVPYDRQLMVVRSILLTAFLS